MPSLLSVNVGRPRPIPYRGKQVMTGIFKEPVVGRVAARGTSLGGDEQANRKVHGGVDKAVYAYAREDELSTGLEPGTFGENLTTLGLDLNGALVGERWRVGPGPTSGSSRRASWAPAMRSRSCSGPSTE